MKIENEVGEWFPVSVGVRQGCVMSPWLLNLYMDWVVRELQTRSLGIGTQLVGDCEEKWGVSQVIFADDMVLAVDSKKLDEAIW